MAERASLAGFVLVGGKSSRMGEDKALLPFEGIALAQHLAAQLSKVADSVSLIGPPALYGRLGYPIFADAIPGRGPLSGIEAALHSPGAAQWNLIVACDMPALDAPLFTRLIAQRAQAPEHADCIVPETNGKLQPLCALYRHRCGPLATAALSRGTRRVVDFVAMLQAEVWPVPEVSQFRNVNTRPEWMEFLSNPTDDRRVPSLP